MVLDYPDVFVLEQFLHRTLKGSTDGASTQSIPAFAFIAMFSCISSASEVLRTGNGPCEILQSPRKLRQLSCEKVICLVFCGHPP